MFEELFSERGLSLDRLKTLLEVHNAGSIAAAARDDITRQSQYSRQIKELEEYFGTELSRRQGKHLVLTSAGKELTEIIQETFNRLQDYKTRRKHQPYRFTLGGGDSLLSWVISPAMARACRQNRPWHFTLKNLRNADVALGLRHMDIDFGVLRTSALESEGLDSLPICTLDYALYIPRSWAGISTITDSPAAFETLLATRPLATLGGKTTFHTTLLNSFRQYGIPLHIQCRTESFPTAAHLLRSGAYMAILPCIAEIDLPPDSCQKIIHPALTSLTRNISLAWNPRLLKIRPHSQDIIDFLTYSPNTPDTKKAGG